MKVFYKNWCYMESILMDIAYFITFAKYVLYSSEIGYKKWEPSTKLGLIPIVLFGWLFFYKRWGVSSLLIFA